MIVGDGDDSYDFSALEPFIPCYQTFHGIMKLFTLEHGLITRALLLLFGLAIGA
ncbi:MAG: hypothetical protein RJB62_1255 [Pseudomonadota bacterium]